MISLARWFALLAVPFALTSLVGCAAQNEDEEEIADDSEDALRKGAAEQWIYNGTMPHLENPSVTVSLTAHTARVTGLVPEDWNAPLPYYAAVRDVDGRKEVSVVYPVATGVEVNSQGSSYRIERASPWVPTNEKATWGGFPFIPYNKGIAFHGPITAADGNWRLIRGPVSHGCNRMQGEHIVELAHLIGIDMTSKHWRGTPVTGLSVPVTVLRKADTWNNQPVDVDYPVQRGVQRPTGANVKMFKSWSADQLAAFVCPLNPRDASNGVVPENYCSRRHRNAFDPATGPARSR